MHRFISLRLLNNSHLLFCTLNSTLECSIKSRFCANLVLWTKWLAFTPLLRWTCVCELLQGCTQHLTHLNICNLATKIISSITNNQSIWCVRLVFNFFVQISSVATLKECLISPSNVPLYVELIFTMASRFLSLQGLQFRMSVCYSNRN